MKVPFRTWPGRLVARPWLLSFVPINAATAGFGVVLPLLILIPLHGSWADVAVAATLFNAAVILSSVVWGHLSDRYPMRRTFLVINYGGYAGLYLLLTHVGSLPELFAAYAVIGAIAPAGASASNLLILEKFTESERATAFASFQEMSMIGSVVGLVIGYFWTLASDSLLTLLYVLAGLALASAVAIWFGITDSKRTLTTASVVRHPESLFSRLRPVLSFQLPIPFFPHRPRLRPAPVARFRKWAREELHHELPLIMVASFLFNLSANLFNISYTPYLYAAGLAASSIFLVNISNNVTQTLVFPLTGGLANRWARTGSSSARRTSGRSVPRHRGVHALRPFAERVVRGEHPRLRPPRGRHRRLHDRELPDVVPRPRGPGCREPPRGQQRPRWWRGGRGSGARRRPLLVRELPLVFLVSGGLLLASLPLWTAASIAYARRRYSPAVPPDRGGDPPERSA